jgi:hypothetical protein
VPAPVQVSSKAGGKRRVPPSKFVYKGAVNLETCAASCPDLDVTVNGIDFWESLEATLITLPVRALALCTLPETVCCCTAGCARLHVHVLNISASTGLALTPRAKNIA